MSNTLKKISVPALGQSFGSNIEQTFKDIDGNFGILANPDLIKGVRGTSLVSLNVSFNDLLSEDESVTVEGYKIPTQRDLFINMFKELKEKISGTDVSDDDPDINSIINELISGDGKILIVFEEPQNGEDINILNSIPYVFVDSKFVKGDSDNPRSYDLSGTIKYKYDSAAPSWECLQNFPTLYMDNESFYWVIDGVKTKISAQGPAGKDGIDGNFLIGLTNSTDLPSSPDDVKPLEIDMI